MRWLYAILLVLSPAILYGFALFAAAFAIKYYRRPCFACLRRGLKCESCILATVVVNGEPAPDSWSYYVCEKCGAAFKRHRGVWNRVSRDEVHQFDAPVDMKGRDDNGYHARS